MSGFGGNIDLSSGEELGNITFSLCINISACDGISFKRNCCTIGLLNHSITESPSAINTTLLTTSKGDSTPLWRSFVVGHFIGDAPHIGSLHATVNRIWTTARDGSKIDVQFIEKNTVLFRIENALLREKVIKRRCWHVADVPRVVREWSPETALDPLDLSALPMWIDLKGVPNMLFSRKGLKCLSRAAGKFVKLHPNAERCTRLDVARVLVEVNLQQPLVEKISFTNQEGQKVVIGVTYPWLPPRCTVCKGWGHKGSDRVGSNVVILSKTNEDTPPAIKTVVHVEDEGNGLRKNAVADLLRDLECLDPVMQDGDSGHNGAGKNVEFVAGKNVEFSVGEGNLEKMIVQEQVEEKNQEIAIQKDNNWAVINGGRRHSPMEEVVNGESSSSRISEPETVVSPSRFTVLASIDEDIEDTEVEEGEVVSEDEHTKIVSSEQPKDQVEHRNRKGKQVPGVVHKSAKKKVECTQSVPSQAQETETRVESSQQKPFWEYFRENQADV
ncbi:hypothetical protein F2Q68_00004938 [Brassica cretica]|uniref:DUF4283 domain-containing protein n=1 Tax=Brassica cretica TaxID=69181 RepID=A0A8S9JDQ0_BRACR|nr:hypothetical protein F2Q68_00004938 [Brassica cretica]